MSRVDAMLERRFHWIMRATIAGALVAFNLVAVFGLDSLLHDDPAGYGRVVDGKFPRWMLAFNVVSPFTEWIGWNLLAVSPALARGIYVALLMVPLSCCLFHIMHVRFGVPALPAFAAAVLPNILPGQWQIPAGVNMSYVLWGMLAAALSCLGGLRYLDQTDGGRRWLAAAAIGYLLAAGIMEQALFLYPPLILAFLIRDCRGRRTLHLAWAISLVALVRLVHIVVLPRQPLGGVSWEGFLDRTGLLVQWSLPAPQTGPIPSVPVFLALVCGGLAASLLPPTAGTRRDVGDVVPPGAKYSASFYAYFACWTSATMLVFLALSRDYSPRYTYIASYGMNALATYSLFLLLCRVRAGFRLQAAIFAAIVVASGVQRHLNLHERFAKINEVHAVLARDLRAQTLPPDAQIVLGGAAVIDAGWRRSSGYLQYLLRRPDVSGLVSPMGEHDFQRAVDSLYASSPGRRVARQRRSGFAIERPTFLFLLDAGRGQLRRMDYVLHWQGTPGEGDWTLLGPERESGRLYPFRSGRGMTSCRAALDELRRAGTARNRILWKGPPGWGERSAPETNGDSPRGEGEADSPLIAPSPEEVAVLQNATSAPAPR